MESVNEQSLQKLREMPAAESCRIIDFQRAEVRPGIVNGTYFLIVTGEAPCANMSVDLTPLVYIRRPEYWEIEVVACLPGPFCLPEVKAYTEIIALNGILGSRGIEVVGASRRQRINVPSAEPTGTNKR